MSLLSDLKMYSRFAWGLRNFLRHPITLEDAKRMVQKRMTEREENFLRIVRRGIFGYPKSPYLPLMKLAHCEMGDIEKMVRDKGLEDTLRALREAGVYISFEEFKGHKPIVRNGKIIQTTNHEFDNPYLSPYYYPVKSGGTTGAGTRVALDLDHIKSQAPFVMIGMNAHGLLNLPALSWWGIPPDITGFESLLLRANFSYFPKKWFYPMTKQDFHPSLKHRLATHSIILMGRLLGFPLPRPEPLGLDQAERVAKWAVETLKTEGSCLISSHISMLLRIGLAAQEKGYNLTGATFLGGGEPPTPAKVNAITRSGARYIPHYFFAETGVVAWSCTNPFEINDLHLFKDGLALIQFPRQVPNTAIMVDSFHFTTLLFTAPKLLLNVESDDYGIIERRSCGCPFETFDYTLHIRKIRSYRKLTGEGVTLVGSEMIHILEEVLPRHFGGSPLDYQLMEDEDERGFTRLNLIISPKIRINDEKEVMDTILKALGESSVSADLARAIWSQAGSFRIKRREPVWTERGKLMPLHLSRRSIRSKDES